MNTGWPALLLVTVMLSAGCATGRTTHVKAGASDAERKRDENECLRSALDHIYRAPILIPIAIDREVFQSCLEARGYTAVRQ